MTKLQIAMSGLTVCIRSAAERRRLHARVSPLPIIAGALLCRAYALANAHTDKLTRYAGACWTLLLAERLTSIVLWRGEDAELLHEAEQVPFGPLFHNLTVHNAVDVSAG